MRSFKLFDSLNVLALLAITALCILPFIHLLAVSFSSNVAAMANEVKLVPIGFTLDAYHHLSQKKEFFDALLVSVERLLIGTLINMFLVIITAYPLSKDSGHFRARTAYVWFFAVTLFFGGGLIPSYMIVKETGIMNSIWALILPGALNVWHLVLLLNFFRNVPKELNEAATIDGAGHWAVLWKIYLPISLPAIATIVLFTSVMHWNAWFDGIIYLNSPDSYPLQSYLYTLVVSINKQAIGIEDLEALKNVNEKTLHAAQIFLGALPILLVYPFLQKYFVKGITIGSVKG